MAYPVWHDAYDNGAMDVYPKPDLSLAEVQAKADKKNEAVEAEGMDGAGHWAAYEVLPKRVRVYKIWK